MYKIKWPRQMQCLIPYPCMGDRRLFRRLLCGRKHFAPTNYYLLTTNY
jgi:hypothetical protein